jgi:kumamolisin
MDKSRVLVATILAIVFASVMVMSPLGAPLTSDVEKDLTGAMQTVGASLEAIFPQTVNTGPLPQSTELRIGVSLPLQNPDQLNNLVQAVSTPGSAQFRQFITPAQFDSTYSPSAASYASLESYFEGYGLHMETSSNRLILGVTGNPNQMGAAFHTSFAQFKFPNGQTYYGPTSAPTVPSTLGLSAAYGFTNALFNTPLFEVDHSAAKPSGNVPLACGSGGDTPTQIRTAYLLTSLPSGDTGTGMKLSTVDAYDSGDKQATLTTDVNDFDSGCGLATPTIVYNYPVPSTTYNSSSSSGWGGEEDLDMQWSHAMAPGATLEMTFSPDSGNGLYEAVDSLVAGDVVNAITLSWGEPDVGIYGGAACTLECNASTDGSYAILHPILEAGAAEGISTFVASGDCGAADGTNTASTDYPSSDEDATGVGGTTITLSGGAYGSESAWSGNESGASCDNGGGAGGGWSPQPQPWYQHGYGIKNKGLRGDPDVGITVGTFLVIYSGGSATEECGTSDGAPMWAGLAAVVDQIHGGDVGLLNPTIYSILRSGATYNSSWHDISTGTGNGYAPTKGWDPVTGVGTPIADVLLPELANGGLLVTQTGLSATLTPSTTTPAAKATVTFTAAATGGSGTYSKYTFNFGDGNAITTRSTTTTHAYANAGAYSADVEVFDNSGNSTASSFVQMSVGSTPFTITLSANATSGAVGTPIQFSIAITGGTSPYTIQYYFGDGSSSPINQTATTYTHVYRAPGVFGAQVTAQDSKSPQDGASSNVVTITIGGSPTVTLNSVAVSPTNPTVSTSGTLPFTATPTCSSTCPGTITYSWALTSATLGTLSGSGTSDTFTAGTTAGTVGLYVNATLSGTTKTASTIITVTSTPTTISSVAVSPTTPTVTTGGQQAFTATPTCSATCPGTITYAWVLTSTTLGTLAGSGTTDTFTAGTTAGTVGMYVNATLGATTVSTSTIITVSAQTISLTGVTMSPTTPNVASGSQTVFTATPTCTPSCPGSGISYVWALSSTSLGTLSGSATTDTFTAGTTAGTVSIYVNATYNSVTQGATTIITVNGPTLDSVAVSPLAPSVTASSQTSFTAAPSCTPSCPTSGLGYTWSLTSTSLGSLSGSGSSVTFTALTTSGTVGIFVNASLGTTVEEANTVITVSGTSTVTLNSVSVSPIGQSVASGKTQVYTATPVCSSTCPTITYVWSLTRSALGSLSGSGSSETFTAGTTAMTGGIFVNATLSLTTKEASTTITVTTSSSVALTGISVSPSTISVSTGSEETFTATITCTGGNTCPSGTVYSWTLSNADGNISTSGVTSSSAMFTAGNSVGTEQLTVTATLSGVVQTTSAVISITASPSNGNGGLSSTMLLLVIVAVVAVVAVVAAVLILRRKPKAPPMEQPPAQWNEGQAYGNQPAYEPQPQDPTGGVSTGYGYMPPPGQ